MGKVFAVLGWLWKGVSAASTVVWLMSVGGAAVVSAIVGSVTGLGRPWSFLLAAGVFLVFLGGSVEVLSRRLPRQQAGAPSLPAPASAPAPKADDPFRRAEALRQTHETKQLRLALSQIAGELEEAQHVLTDGDAPQFFLNHFLPDERWKQQGNRLIDAGLTELHKTVRAAYREINAMNNRGITRDVVSRGRPTTLLDGQRVQAARDAVAAALEALDGTGVEDVPRQNDIVKLADALQALAGELGSFLDASELERPGERGKDLAEIMHAVQRESKAERETRQEAVREWEQARLKRYYMEYRTRALQLFDRAAQEQVVASSFRPRFEKPGEHLGRLPEHLTTMAKRLRGQES